MCCNIAFRTSRKPRPLSENLPLSRFSLDMPSQPALPETPRSVSSEASAASKQHGRMLQLAFVDRPLCKLLTAGCHPSCIHPVIYHHSTCITSFLQLTFSANPFHRRLSVTYTLYLRMFGEFYRSAHFSYFYDRLLYHYMPHQVKDLIMWRFGFAVMCWSQSTFLGWASTVWVTIITG